LIFTVPLIPRLSPELQEAYIERKNFLNAVESETLIRMGFQQKPLFLPIIAYTLCTTKLEIRAK
jgi:hypothetical protein